MITYHLCGQTLIRETKHYGGYRYLRAGSEVCKCPHCKQIIQANCVYATPDALRCAQEMRGRIQAIRA